MQVRSLDRVLSLRQLVSHEQMLPLTLRLLVNLSEYLVEVSWNRGRLLLSLDDLIRRGYFLRVDIMRLNEELMRLDLLFLLLKC